jgi:hypothetical protein
MLDAMIRLDLKTHCIETEIRRLFDRAMSDYFRADEARRLELEPRLALLEAALKTLDFADLRTRSPELAGGSGAEAFLKQEESGPVVVSVKKK